ncbi:MAG: hypothetical protein AAF530_19630 [Pseudomonadota bacterium]
MKERERQNDMQRQRRIKNWALLAVLLAFVILVYFVSIIRMGGAS